MRNGVTIVDPASTYIDATVTIGQDTTIEPGTTLKGATTDRRRRDDPAVLRRRRRRSATASRSARSPTCAPAPSCSASAKAGTFVEIKNSDIGEGTKVPHLSYIGDADVGPGTQPRRGHDHGQLRQQDQAKNRTTIGANVKTSVDTTLVSPVSLGDGAYTAAGSVVTQRRPARCARRRASAPAQHRGLRGPRLGGLRRVDPAAAERRPRRLRCASDVSIPTRTMPVATSLPIDYDKRLMLFSGRANPELAAKIGEQARRRPRSDHAQDLQERRGLLPLRGVDPRRGRLPHPADLRQPRDGRLRQRRADGAAGHDRRGGRRERAPRDRRHAVVRLHAARTRSPRRASRSARASSPGCSRPPAPTAS